jgi:predicted nucleic-acid-binding protein
MKYICDTNFVIRYLIADNEEMFAKTKDIFDQVQTGQVTLIIEQTVFTEIIFVLSSFYKVPKEKITEILSKLLLYKGIVSDKEVLLLALDYYHNTNLHIVDCLLLAQAKITATPILTFDRQLSAYALGD